MPTKALIFFSVAVLATAALCHLELSAARGQSVKPIVLASHFKPNETLPVPNVSSATIEKRSDDDDDGDQQGKSLFRSIIPISPFKKPIKTIFRSWFEPNADALKDDSTSSSFYFIRPQKKAVFGPPLYSKSVDATIPQAASPYRLYSNKYTSRQSNGRAQYAYQPSAAASTNQHSDSRSQSGSPTFAIGDPENGRGITFSLGDGPKQSSAQYGLATNQNYQSAAASPQTQNGGSSSSASNGGGGGLSFSLGGRGGGSGLSFNLGGGGGGGGSRGGGLSLSLGGGRGIGLNLGGGGGGGDSTPEQGSSSSNYPSYSGYGSNSYGSSYGSSYSNNYYPTKPKFSITMPSSGKTVIEANMRPPTMKVKVNASPKVKITTGTRDPLEKPPLEEEVIMEDIFGPPAPFEKPMKSNTTDNDTFANGFNHTFPYYPYYPPYYQYPYNYYYNYYQQQYPGYYSQPYGSGYQSKSPYGGPSSYPQTQYPSQYGSQYSGQYGGQYRNQYSSQYGSPYSSQHNSSSTTFKHRPIELAAAASKNNKWQLIPAPAPASQAPAPPKRVVASSHYPPDSSPYSLNAASQVTRRQPVYQEFGGQGKQQVNFMDHNSVSYKRSSASSSYNKDMLTLGSNSIVSYAKPESVSPKKLYKAQESKNYYHYELSPKQSTGPNNLASSATNTYPYYSQPGTGVGYSYYNGSSGYNASSSYPGYPGSYYHPYYNNPYYYNYYKDYYNYAKQYYESYYGNYSAMHNQTGHGNGTYNPYYKSRKSISGFSQDNFDHHQSKIFGSKVEKYPGGSTKEDKSRIIMDIRPRVTFRMLNRTQAEEEQKKLHHHKKKDHIFKTKLTILMLSTTTTPKPLYDHNYYGYNYYEDDADEFGYTKGATTHESHTTPLPKVTTTRRRTTTTEEPSTSGEGSEEENGSGETTSQEDEESSSTTSTTTTTTTEAPEEDNSTSEEVDDDRSKEGTTSTTTTTTESSKSEEEVIDANEETKNDAKTDAENEAQSEERVEEKDDDENSSLEEASKPVTIPASATGGNVTVSPELVAAMIKALQEALGVTPPSISNQLTTTTPSPIISTMAPLGGDESEETKDEETNSAADSSENHDPEPEEPEEEEVSTTTTTTRRPKTKDSKNSSKSKQIPTVHSTVVKNTTQLRLKTPVLSVQSAKGAASTLVKTRTSLASSKNSKASRGRSSAASVELTTTSPFIILSKGMGLGTNKNKANDVSRVIDGNAVLSNFNVDDLTDDERRDMLTNILSVIQSKNSANEIEQTVASSKQAANTAATSRGSRRKSKETGAGTKLLPVTKANNVRIVSSLDELTKSDKSIDGSSNAPIYVVLLPQNKKKK